MEIQQAKDRPNARDNAGSSKEPRINELQSFECGEVSSFFPSLGSRFDLRTNEDYLRRYADIQRNSFSEFTLKTTTQDAISTHHSAPMCARSTVLRFTDALFRDPVYGFRDQLVVDLGAGANPDGYLIARDLGARGYIGVDFAFAPTLHRQLGELPNYERTIPYAVVYDSIEEILPAIPEGSCSFICGGIDDFFPGFTRVVASLEEHLPTKLHPKGALLLASASYERYSFPGLRALSRPFSFTVFGRR